MNPYDQTLQSVAAENPYDQTVRRVYHGTPATFAPTATNVLGEFDTSKMGSGEGNQSYGWGTYVAEHKPIAVGYRNALAPTVDVQHDTPFLEKRVAQMAMTFGNSPKGAIKWLKRHTEKGAPHLTPALTPELARMVAHKFESGHFKQGGSLYHAEIPQHHIDRMLDMDKEMQEQPEVARLLGIPIRDVDKEMVAYSALRAKFKTDEEFHSSQELAKLEEDAYKIIDHPQRKMTGQEIYERIKDEKAAALRWKIRNGEYVADTNGEASKDASLHLHSLGIPGIKYLDASSRGSDEKNPSRNFVLFDPSIAKIVERE